MYFKVTHFDICLKNKLNSFYIKRTSVLLQYQLNIRLKQLQNSSAFKTELCESFDLQNILKRAVLNKNLTRNQRCIVLCIIYRIMLVLYDCVKIILFEFRILFSKCARCYQIKTYAVYMHLKATHFDMYLKNKLNLFYIKPISTLSQYQLNIYVKQYSIYQLLKRFI